MVTKDSPVHIASTEDGTVTISVSKTIKVVLPPEMIDAIIAIRKKAKMKKCWIDRPVPQYYWEDHNGQGRKARAAAISTATRNENK